LITSKEITKKTEIENSKALDHIALK